MAGDLCCRAVVQKQIKGWPLFYNGETMHLARLHELRTVLIHLEGKGYFQKWKTQGTFKKNSLFEFVVFKTLPLKIYKYFLLNLPSHDNYNHVDKLR
jgi:hypothetical protein